jgi:hypothetical protein
MNKIFAAAATAAALLTTSANAMDFKVAKMNATDSVLLATGEIISGDAEKLIDFMSRHPELDSTNTVFLESIGGAINESRWIAELFRKLGYRTVVPADGLCSSACFELWAAGTTRAAGPNAKIGVHRVYYQGMEENDASRSLTIDYAERLRALGVPRSILASLMLQKSRGMYYLTNEDLAEMKAFRYGDAQTAQAPAPAPTPTQSFAVTAVPDSAPQDLRAQKRIEFDETYAKALEVSKAQNRGLPALIKNCDSRRCEEILAFRDRNNYYVEMHRSLNSDSRALCRLTRPGLLNDEYLCKNYITGETHTYRWSRDPLL